MHKLDILQENLYIKKLIHVIKSEINFTSKKIHVTNRHSDAFIYILSGSCMYVFDDKAVLTAGEGDILYLASNSIYEMFLQSSNYQFIYCDFEFDCEFDRKSDVFRPKNKVTTKILFEKLYHSYTNPDRNSFHECLSDLYAIYSVIYNSRNNEYFAQSIQQRVAEIKLYIDRNFNISSLSVAFLAEKANMSEAYFRKVFKSIYNISPAKYITLVRMEKAKQFMSYPFITLEECAKRCGFSSQQYFCRVFKKNIGMTPAEYKKRIFL